jgi:chromosome segregation ATPase
MDFYNPDDWTKLETAFTSAPRWALIVAAGAAGGLLGWWLNGTRSVGKVAGLEGKITGLEGETAGKVAGLEGRISVLNERLNLAADKAAIADRAKDELEKQVQILRVELAALTAKAENASLAKVEAQLQKVEIATGDLATANNAVTSTLSMSLKATDARDIASFTVDTTQRH